MNPNDFEEQLTDLETRVDRLRALYENWFRGYEKQEPRVARKDVERRVYGLRKELPRNTALRFRYHQLYQRYTTLTTYWSRTSRQIEEGTHRLQLERLRRKKNQEALAEPMQRPRAERGEASEGDEKEPVLPGAYELDMDESLNVDDLLNDLEMDAVARAVDGTVPPPATRATFGKPKQSVVNGTSQRPVGASQLDRPSHREAFFDDEHEHGAGGSLPLEETRPSEPQKATKISAPQPSALQGVRTSSPRPSLPETPTVPAGARPSLPQPSPLPLPGGLPKSPPLGGASMAPGPLGPITMGPPPVPAAPKGSAPGVPAPTTAKASSPGSPSPTGPGRPPAPPPPVPAKPPAAPGATALPPAGMGRPSFPERQTAQKPLPFGAPAQPIKPAPVAAVGSPPPRPASPAPPPVQAPKPPIQPVQTMVGRPAPRSPIAGPAPRPPEAPMADQTMRRIYNEYAAARRKNNEGDVRYEALVSSIQKMMPDLQKKHAGKKIDFEVVVKDGRVGLKPKAT